MMLSAAWVLVAALCISKSHGYVIPNVGKNSTDVYGGQQNPQSGYGKPHGWGSGSGTAKDPTKKITDPTPETDNPYWKGPWGSNQSPGNGSLPDADGKSDSDDKQHGVQSPDGHQDWAPMPNGTASSATDKQPYPTPDGDETDKPKSCSESDTDGHQPWVPAPGGNPDQPKPWGPYPNGTASDGTSQHPYPAPEDDGSEKPYSGSDSGSVPPPFANGTFCSPQGKFYGNSSDGQYYPSTGEQDGHEPWSPTNGTVSSPDHKLPDNSVDHGRPWVKPDTPVNPYSVYQNGSECSAPDSKSPPPYQDSFNNGTQPAWNGTDASPTHDSGDKSGDEDENDDGKGEGDDDEDNDEKSGSNNHTLPHGDVQSPDSKYPEKGDGHEKSPSTGFSQPIYRPISYSPGKPHSGDGGY